jgi:hypothetical protein
MSLKTPSQIRSERMRLARRYIKTGSFDPPTSKFDELTTDQLIERLDKAKNQRETRQIIRELANRIL